MDGSNTIRGNSGPIAAVGYATCLMVLLAGCNLFTDLDRFEKNTASTKDAGREDNGHKADAGDHRDAGDGDAGTSVPGCESPLTLCLRLENFTPHVDELVVVDLVSADHILRSRAMLDPLADGSATADIVLPEAIDPSEVPAQGETHPLHLEIFGDKTGDGMYNPSRAAITTGRCRCPRTRTSCSSTTRTSCA